MNNSADKSPIIPCSLSEDARNRIEIYAAELRAHAPSVGTHGLGETEFWESGLFQSAVERLRGTGAATTTDKQTFLRAILTELQNDGRIAAFDFTGAGERHDYQIELPSGHVTIFEAKGCLDGNNTNIFTRPPNADEFFIWSLCQNPGADPRHNTWSGIHTRLGATMIAERQRIDGLVIWDMLCGTLKRPCPKLIADLARGRTLPGGRELPPPCIYLFPRSLPDPRNNPQPAPWRLEERPFLHTLAESFGCRDDEVVAVNIHVRMNGANVERQTTLTRGKIILRQSRWTTLRRATR